MFDELRNFTRSGDYGGFLPGMKQIGNVAALPGIVHVSHVASHYLVYALNDIELSNNI